MKRINMGTFDYNQLTYTKKVKFSKAVLWKDRELSLPIPVMKEIKDTGIMTLIFNDKVKKELWKFDTRSVLENCIVKQVGQEPQVYFSIDLAKKIDYSKPPKILDPNDYLPKPKVKLQGELF